MSNTTERRQELTNLTFKAARLHGQQDRPDCESVDLQSFLGMAISMLTDDQLDHLAQKYAESSAWFKQQEFLAGAPLQSGRVIIRETKEVMATVSQITEYAVLRADYEQLASHEVSKEDPVVALTALMARGAAVRIGCKSEIGKVHGEMGAYTVIVQENH